jgi:hypothetical protein
MTDGHLFWGQKMHDLPGQWALITGASSGFCQDFAQLLAGRASIVPGWLNAATD